MCGRYSLFEVEILKKQYGIDIEPMYNIAPSMTLPIITSDGIRFAKWGFVPNFAKTDKLRPINTRVESLMNSFYKHSFESKRCLVLADGFYEWDKERIPYRVELKEKKLFCFAGIWDVWEDSLSFSIITTDSSRQLKKIHERMPVIVEDEKLWLQNPDRHLLKPYEKELVIYQVSKSVNSPSNNSKEILKKEPTLQDYDN